MQKTNYFDLLESLAFLADKSIRRACTGRGQERERSAWSEALGLLCDCEKALFADFLPPLERHSIAACAHALCRVILAAERLGELPPPFSHEKDWAPCLSLSEQLCKEIGLLRRVRKPTSTPNLRAFRENLRYAEESHGNVQKRIWARGASTGAPQAVTNLSDLYHSLAFAYDMLVEVMLMNI